MSCSEEESTAASVLSQMSQIQQSPTDPIEPQGMNVAHQCDVETTSSTNCNQEIVSVAIGPEESCPETLTGPSELDQGMDAASTTSSLPLSSGDQETKLQTTLEVSSVKVFPCEFCGKVFNKSYNLKTHHRVHTGERPFPCPVCGHGFANLGDLKRHARTHTGEKPFTCEFCNKAFSDFGSHKRHLRLHTGFKPFKCEQCDRQFTRLDSFKNHARLHTGERPYKCDECQKEFNYLTTYKRHLNIHSGERPYSCDLCDKKFTRLNYLKNHKLSHNKLPLNTEPKETQGGNNEEMNTTEIDGSQISHVSVEDMTECSSEKTCDENDHVIQQMTQALSEGGVQVSVTTVVDTSGQPILIQTPVDGSDSSETTSHTLILTQDDNQHVLSFATDPNDKDSVFIKDDGTEESTETRQLFITQPLFRSAQDFSSETITESQFISPNFDTIMAVTQEDGNIVVSEVNEQIKQTKDDSQTDESEPTQKVTSGGTSEEPVVSLGTSLNSNAVYIAIDPTQTNVQQILSGLHVAVNPESLIKGT